MKDKIVKFLKEYREYSLDYGRQRFLNRTRKKKKTNHKLKKLSELHKNQNPRSLKYH